jgi:spermidine synthase
MIPWVHLDTAAMPGGGGDLRLMQRGSEFSIMATGGIALSAWGKDAAITVAELVPAVVAWARGPLAGVFDGCLDDPRVEIHETDVATLIRAAEGDYDAILLDVDNGPEGLTRKANDALYDWEGLAAARRALRPGGLLAVWSSAQHPDFSKRLRQSSFAVDEVRPRANGGRRGGKHVVWLATRN